MTGPGAAATVLGPRDDGALLARARAGDLLLGTFAGLASSVAVEAVSAAGIDWILIDLEHGAGGEEQVGAGLLAAAAYGTSTIVRVESTERVRAGRVLDLGVAGVMFPRIETVADAAAAVRSLRYPPAGERGAATYNRQGRFGLDPGVLDRVADEILGIIQVETASAMENLPAIAATDGVDVLFVGPVDLSYALGSPRDFAAPKFVDALDAVVAACRANGIAAGILASTPDAAARYAAQGFTFISIASDAMLLAAAMRDALASVTSATIPTLSSSSESDKRT